MRKRPSLRRTDLERAELTAVLLRARSGERDAETVFISRTIADVHRYCAHLVGPQRADDATQATYLRAIGSMHNFRGEAPAKAWLIGVARNACYDLMRAEQRRTRLYGRVSDAAKAEQTTSASPEQGVHLDAALVHLAVSDPDRHEAFVLTQVIGLPYADAAEVLGVPIGTVRSRVARARRDLVAWWNDGEDLGEAQSTSG